MGLTRFEPYVDTATMTIHHDRHHGAYVAALNGLVENIQARHHSASSHFSPISRPLPEAVRGPVRNNLGGTGTTPSFGS